MKQPINKRPLYFDFATFIKESVIWKGWQSSGKFSSKDYEDLFKTYREAHPLFFSVSYEEEEVLDNIEGTHKLTLPFQCCWFEILNKHKMTVSIYLPDSPHLEFSAMMIKEISPTQYKVATFFQDIKGGRTQRVCLFEETHDLDLFFKSWNTLYAFATKVSTMLEAGTMVSEVVHRVTHVPMPERLSKTKPHEINQIIHVVPKKRKKESTTPLFGGVIDWSHRWEVRGHWRKTEGLGKDRAGLYCVSGFTWVKEHEKGPEERPLVKKIRVIDETKEEKGS